MAGVKIRVGHLSYRPVLEGVDVKLTYMTAGGLVQGGTFPIKSESQLQVNPAEVVANADFSTMVYCVQGLDISADRTMTVMSPCRIA